MVRTISRCIEDSRPLLPPSRTSVLTIFVDEWIKMKYILALTPYEPADVKSVQGKHNFHEMTSNQVMQEIQAYNVAAQNA
jgi:hypothetical protein